MLLSVRLMTYNHEAFIVEALEGINNQKTDFEFEVVIGDDFSTDNTLSLIKNFEFTNPKIRVNLLNRNKGDAYYILRQKHGRIYNFFDILKNCQGNYIALLDGDDYWTDPLKLQRQVDFLDQNKTYGFCFTRFKVLNDNTYELNDDKNGYYFKENIEFIVFDFKLFTDGWYGGVPTLVFRAANFDTNLILSYKYFRDIYLFAELLKSGKGVCLNFFSSIYRVHDGGLYSSTKELERAYSGVLCYRELYMKNQSISYLKIKFRNFSKIYINQLIVSKKYFRTIGYIIIFSFNLKETYFFKNEMKKLLKEVLIALGLKRNKKKKREFPGSQQYWEQRYLDNNNSGAGSYGRLAEFKAEIINTFVENNSINSIVEFGCGDGNQLLLANYPSYLGLDVSNKAIEICKEKFKNDESKRFQHLSQSIENITPTELVLSLDVIYHLIEDEVFYNYMRTLFKTSTKYVLIYSSNYEAILTDHVKCRKFTDWIDNNVSKQWYLYKYIQNKYPFESENPNNTSIADFYIYKKND